MPATLIDGRAVAARVRAQVAAEVRELTAAGGPAPGLATVIVGDDPASRAYVRGKHRASEEVGIRSVHHDLPAEASQPELEALVDVLNEDPDVDGILVQSPLPAGFDEPAIFARVDPRKDVDGFHPLNVGRLVAARPGLRPPTPSGVLELLRAYDVPLSGAEAVVVGRSDIVGKPLALLLLHANATVTLAHSRTRDLAAVTRRADILCVAIGRPHLVTPDMIRPGAVVVDVGVNRLDDGLTGDVHPGVAEVASLLSPVPGGVGPMTIAMLLRNTVEAARAAA